MKTQLLLLISIFLLSACQDNSKPKQATTTDNPKATDNKIVKADYELIKPESEIKAVLVLFGGFPQTAKDIQREFPIMEKAKQNGIALLLMNFNRKLWLEEEEKSKLAQLLNTISIEHQLPTENIYMGGFSSGGNVSLLLSNHLTQQQDKIQPKGVFIVDSPIDLEQLYRCAERNIERNFTEGSVQEAKGIISMLGQQFGAPKDSIDNYVAHSPYLYSAKNISNLQALQNSKLRFYTEPDTTWWKENRENDYEDMNAYYIKQLALQLQTTFNSDNIQLIETQNKGKRANGMRHPHSWSIVEQDDLIAWILK